MSGWQESGVGVGAERAAEEEDEGFGFVDLVVGPAAALLHAERPPLVLAEQTLLRHLLEDVLRQQHVRVVVHVVLVLLGVLDLVGEMWHLSR